MSLSKKKKEKKNKNGLISIRVSERKKYHINLTQIECYF